MKVVNVFKQPYDIYIGRKNIDLGLEESIWANPFKINSENNRADVLEMYRQYIISNETLYNKLEELEDKKIGCYCKPKNKCHGDILKELLEEKKYNIEYYINIFSDVFDHIEYEKYNHCVYFLRATKIDSIRYEYQKNFINKINKIITNNGITFVDQKNYYLILCPINNPIIRRNLNLKNLLDLI